MSQTTDLTVWKIHGHELRFDMEDAEELERYEAAFAGTLGLKGIVLQCL